MKLLVDDETRTSFWRVRGRPEEKERRQILAQFLQKLNKKPPNTKPKWVAVSSLSTTGGQRAAKYLECMQIFPSTSATTAMVQDRSTAYCTQIKRHKSHAYGLCGAGLRTREWNSDQFTSNGTHHNGSVGGSDIPSSSTHFFSFAFSFGIMSEQWSPQSP